MSRCPVCREVVSRDDMAAHLRKHTTEELLLGMWRLNRWAAAHTVAVAVVTAALVLAAVLVARR